MGTFYSREQRAERMCLHIHSATAARVEYPAAQLRYKFMPRQLAAGYSTLYYGSRLLIYVQFLSCIGFGFLITSLISLHIILP